MANNFKVCHPSMCTVSYGVACINTMQIYEKIDAYCQAVYLFGYERNKFMSAFDSSEYENKIPTSAVETLKSYCEIIRTDLLLNHSYQELCEGISFYITCVERDMTDVYQHVYSLMLEKFRKEANELDRHMKRNIIPIFGIYKVIDVDKKAYN